MSRRHASVLEGVVVWSAAEHHVASRMYNTAPSDMQAAGGAIPGLVTGDTAGD